MSLGRILGVTALGALLLMGLTFGLTSVQARGKHPHPPRNSGPGIPVQNGPLTTAQVTAYVTTHPCFCGPTVDGGNPTLISIQETTFGPLSSIPVTAYYGASPSAQESVFYVKLHGPFVGAVSVPPGSPTPKVNDVGEVFDGKTGRLIEWGSA